MNTGFQGKNVEEQNPQFAPEPEARVDKKTGYIRFLVDLFETLLLSVALFTGMNVVSSRVQVDGTSMEPTLHDQQLVFVNRLAYKFGTPHLGDVIVFHWPPDPGQEYIKRVIGVPGDQVEIQGGEVSVNGMRLEEAYINAPPNYSGSWVVPAGKLFVLGDNRNNSSDSHTWGFVPEDYVIGKALFVYWPPTQMGPILHTVNAAGSGK